MIVFLNGQFMKAEEARVSVFDHGFLYGDGVYETLRTYKGKIWQLEEHLARLGKSAELLGLRLPYSLQELAEFTLQTVQRNGFAESRIRITLTRGISGFDFTSCERATLCIQVQELVPQPEEVYAKGVAVITFQGARPLALAKSISLLPMILAKRAAEDAKVYEAIFVNEKGYVLEGTITNVFIVQKGVLITPKNNILLGTTRQFILRIAKKAGMKVKEKDFKIADLYKADEVFITNAPRGIVPVVKVDGKKIAAGEVGKMTHEIMKLVSVAIYR